MRGSCITSTSMKLGAESHSPEPSASASPNSLRSVDRFSTSDKLLEALTGWRFNSLLLNRYRDGRDAMGWHADDEPELDPSAPIASLSLGASRDFRLRPRSSPRRAPGLPPPEGYSTARGSTADSPCAPFNLKLAHGDLLLMEPPSQLWWQHAVPRRLRVTGQRLNLTFRVVRPQPRSKASNREK